MQNIRLGATDLTVSRLCLGMMTFRLQTDEAASQSILDTRQRLDDITVQFRSGDSAR